MNKILEILLGIVLLVIPIIAAIFNWIPGLGKATLIFISGALVVIVAMIGLLFIILGITELRD